MNTITFEIVDSIEHIARSQWDAVFTDPTEGYGFFQLLESSKLQQFTFRYFLLREDGIPVVIAPAFLADFDLTMATGGFIAKLVRRTRKFWPRFMMMRTLFFGSPFGERGIIGLGDGYDKKALIEELVGNTRGFCVKNNVSCVLFKDFPEKDAGFLGSLKNLGFFHVDSFPSAVTELPFSSFEGYLMSLGHGARKELRRKLKKAHAGYKIEVVETDKIGSVADRIYRLYLNTLSAGSTKFEELSKDFFVETPAKMAPHARFFLYYVNGELAAFNLCFVYNDLFIDKFIGFDYALAKPAQLYFVSWARNVDYCIRHAIRLYQTGQTDYDAKVRFGSRLRRLTIFARHRNKTVTFMLSFLSGILAPHTPDTDTAHG